MGIKALERLYNNALTIPINSASKIVIISDVHRGDGTFFDSLLQNRNIYIGALKYYLNNNYTYVEVGDGDELWKNRDCTEIAYEYNEVFKIFNKFKSKNQIYMIYGNHDIMKRNKNFRTRQENKIINNGVKYGSEFLRFIEDLKYHEAVNLLYQPLNKKILVTHGHQVDFYNNEFWILNMLLVRYIWKFINGIAGFKDPTSSATSNSKRSDEDKKLQQWVKNTGNVLICGHSHNTSFPKYDEPAYFNDGCCVFPYCMTAIEIENLNISLVKWEISAKEGGELYIRRKILEGPNNLLNYLK